MLLTVVPSAFVIVYVGFARVDGLYAPAAVGNKVLVRSIIGRPPVPVDVIYVVGTEAALVTVFGQTEFIADISNYYLFTLSSQDVVCR